MEKSSEEVKKYGIWAVRSASSVGGAAQAWLKENGKPLQYDTYAEAADMAEYYNTECYSKNVNYYPEEMKLKSNMEMRLE
ncbi:hypothetical protein [Hungatella effluvii]|uniref:hypothetical protein n=1 Tax=Hungatella effluvii TaxID=1096246 RepID=UPI0022E97012|nr:hypothetical protein [Hungatella effluvii]